jgi:hypothetical protein
VTTRAKRGAVSAGAAVVATGAAVAVLQLLQQALGAFRPQPIISALFVVAAFFAGLSAGRVRNRGALAQAQQSRREHLAELLGVWPAPTMRHASRVRLGVFPSRRELDTEQYVDRTVDDELRAAMVPGAVVLVVGEARAGVSRTAFQAALVKLADVPVLAPRTPDALRGLLNLDPPLHLDANHVLIWLDGLDRFAEILDVETLAAALSVAQQVTVIGTIRSADWEAWLAASGPAGEAARAVVSRARVFDVPTELDDAEMIALAEAYPSADPSSPIGAALASGGHERFEPLPVPPEPGVMDEPDQVPPMRNDPPLLGAAGATVLSLAALAIVWIVSGFSQPSIEDQLAKVEREGSRGGRRVIVLAPPANLHGTGAKSHVLLFVDAPGAKRPRSDELRVYDEHGDDLVRAFRFEPAGRRAVFQYRSLADLDFDGAEEIAGGFGYPDEARQAIVPFAVEWDRAKGHYGVVPLDVGPPSLSRRPTSIPERQYRQVYAAPTTFVDPRDGLRLTGHRVQDFIVTAPPRRVVAGWFLHPWIANEDAVLELQPAALDATTGTPHVTPCRFSPSPIIVRVGRERALTNAFEDAYAAAATGKGCRSAAFG